MSSNTDKIHLADDFKVQPRFRGHPMRGALPRTPIEREHLLRKPAVDAVHERRIAIRDAVISIFGVVSAAIPMVIAVQSVLGA